MPCHLIQWVQVIARHVAWTSKLLHCVWFQEANSAEAPSGFQSWRKEALHTGKTKLYYKHWVIIKFFFFLYDCILFHCTLPVTWLLLLQHCLLFVLLHHHCHVTSTFATPLSCDLHFCNTTVMWPPLFHHHYCVVLWTLSFLHSVVIRSLILDIDQLIALGMLCQLINSKLVSTACSLALTYTELQKCM